MQQIDILFTASCFKSARSAERMINTTKYIDANIVVVITAPLDEDLIYLKNCNFPNNVYLFKSSVDNMYLCRNWGFLWAINNNITPEFYCSCDDDIEFIPNSKDILHSLSTNNYSVITFDNAANNYPCYGSIDTGTCRVLEWLNGDSMFTRFEDNVKYGLPDCLLDGSPMPYYVESEYQQRLSILTGNPIVADIEKTFYIHHWIDDKEKVELRSRDMCYKAKSGIQFFHAKYYYTPSQPRDTPYDMHQMLTSRIQANLNHTMDSFLYRTRWDGLIGYRKIYDRICEDYKLV